MTLGGDLDLLIFKPMGLTVLKDSSLEEYNGVIVADGVGLGKSFIAGELIRETVQDNRQRALLISPAALRDGTWNRFLHRHQLYVENISLNNWFRPPTWWGCPTHEFKHKIRDLVVIDESQAFRNPRDLIEQEPYVCCSVDLILRSWFS